MLYHTCKNIKGCSGQRARLGLGVFWKTRAAPAMGNEFHATARPPPCRVPPGVMDIRNKIIGLPPPLRLFTSATFFMAPCYTYVEYANAEYWISLQNLFFHASILRFFLNSYCTRQVAQSFQFSRAPNFSARCFFFFLKRHEIPSTVVLQTFAI